MYLVILSVVSCAVFFPQPRYSFVHLISIVVKLYQIKLKLLIKLVVLR